MDVFRVLLVSVQLVTQPVSPQTHRLPPVLAWQRLLDRLAETLVLHVTMHNVSVMLLVVLVAHLPLVNGLRFNV
mgnify:CR=1 FL=1